MRCVESFFVAPLRAGRLGWPAALLAALLAVSLAGCETAEVAAPPDEAVAVQTERPEPVSVRVQPGPLEDLAPLGEGMGGVTEAEVFRGTGILTRRLATDPLHVIIQDDGEVTLNFANADIREVVDVVLGETLGVSYIIDPKVQGQITARTSRPLSRQAVIPALENILALNGAALTLDGGIYKVVTLQQAANALTRPIVAPTRRDLARGYGIHVIPLRYAAAQAMADILKPFIAPGRVLRVDAARNLLIFAGTGKGSESYYDPTIVNKLFGTKFKLVMGYKGGGALDMSLIRGETLGRAGPLLSWVVRKPHWLKEGKIRILAQVGLKKMKGFEDVPLLTSFARNDDERAMLTLISSRAAIGRPFVAPPGVPKARVAALRKAFVDTMNDPKFQADIKKRRLLNEWSTGEEVAKVVANMLATPKSLIERTKAVLGYPK